MINPQELDNDELIATILICIEEATRRRKVLADLIQKLVEITDEQTPEGG